MVEPLPRQQPHVLAHRRNRVQPLSVRFNSSSVHASVTRPDTDQRKFARLLQASARFLQSTLPPALTRPAASCGVTFNAFVRGLEAYGYDPEEAVFATTLSGFTAHCSLRDAVLLPLLEQVMESTKDPTLRITGAQVGSTQHSIMAPVLEFALEAGEDGIVAIWVTMTSEVLAKRRAPQLTTIEVSPPSGIGNLASWRQGVQLASVLVPGAAHAAAQPTLVVVIPPGLAPPGGGWHMPTTEEMDVDSVESENE